MTNSEIEKKDWEDLKKVSEMNLKQARISEQQFLTLLDLCIQRLAAYPKEEPSVTFEKIFEKIIEESEKEK